jgi:hypothetical protein
LGYRIVVVVPDLDLDLGDEDDSYDAVHDHSILALGPVLDLDQDQVFREVCVRLGYT